MPAASVNALPRTDRVALPVAPEDTVNVPVYDVPDPLRAESVPPDTVTSLDTKFEDDSERVKVMVSDVPWLRTPLPARVIPTVGRV